MFAKFVVNNINIFTCFDYRKTLINIQFWKLSILR